MFSSFQLCQAKGFVCEFCGNDKDIIFPFQLNKCQRCEGEPSLLVAGGGGSRAPSPRANALFTWRDWKMPKNRRLARDLSRDRREGEGGEEDLELDDEERKSEEERGILKVDLRDTAIERQEKGRRFKAFATKNLLKAFGRSKGNEEETEMTGVREAEEGREHGVYDRGEMDSSMESLTEVGQERKGRWRVSGLLSLAKGFVKREEGKARWQVEESSERRDGNEAGPGADTFTDQPLLQARPLSAVISRERSEKEEDKCSERDGKQGLNTETPGLQEPAVVTRRHWRAGKTREAKRLWRGRKMKEGTEDTECGETDGFPQRGEAAQGQLEEQRLVNTKGPDAGV